MPLTKLSRSPIAESNKPLTEEENEASEILPAAHSTPWSDIDPSVVAIPVAVPARDLSALSRPRKPERPPVDGGLISPGCALIVRLPSLDVRVVGTEIGGTVNVTAPEMIWLGKSVTVESSLCKSSTLTVFGK